MKKKFRIITTHYTSGKRFGDFQRRMQWIGSDKYDTRPYVSWDSRAHINRKQTAKHQQLYTNLFHQDASIQMDLFLDINYNRRGWSFLVSQQVIAYLQDIITYIHHHHVDLTLWYPNYRRRGSASLVHLSYNKQLHNIDVLSSLITIQVKKTLPWYHSHLWSFLSKIPLSKPKKAIVLFSDFLIMDKDTTQHLDTLKKHHIVFLFHLPIDPTYGQHYEHCFLKTPVSTSISNKEITLL